MKIKKLGHCCFIAEINGKRIMTDPGAFSTLQNNETNITAIIISHEHADHFHVDSLKEVIKNNPNAVIITNTAVGNLLAEAGVTTYVKVEEGETYDLDGITISGFGNTHAEIYGEYGQVQNTGYMIDALCYPGDAFHYPDAKVDILALPVAAPWLKVKDTIDYAKKISPRIAFPVHDAIVSDKGSFVWNMTEHFLSEFGVGFKKLEIGKEEEV